MNIAQEVAEELGRMGVRAVHDGEPNGHRVMMANIVVGAFASGVSCVVYPKGGYEMRDGTEVVRGTVAHEIAMEILRRNPEVLMEAL